MRVIGTCSLCGGQVCVPTMWGAIIPPTPTCQQCGAVAASHGPLIPMRQPEQKLYKFGKTTTTGDWPWEKP